MVRHPNFFIVGAPKCGTTSLYEALRRQPSIFMPHDPQHYWLAKEPNYFCPELVARTNLAVSRPNDYLRLFSPATDQSCVGEASTLYLYSELAAQRIYETYPHGRVIAMFREPVAMMQAWHADNLRHGHEVELSFERALELEEPRRHGRHLPRGCGYPQCLQYRSIANFSQQLERYQRYFAPSQIKVLLLQDLAQQPQRALNDVLNFLGLPAAGLEQLEVHNPRTQLHQGELLKHRLKNWLRGFGIVRAAIKFMPIDFDRVLGRILRPAMSRKVVESSADPGFLADLRRQMRPEVQRLSQLIGRDLSDWEESAEGVASPNIPAPHPV